MRYAARHLAITIEADWRTAYDFIRTPQNLPSWAAGLAAGVESLPDGCFADSPMGRIRLQFAADNPFGVVDHDVTFPDGRIFHNPMRVVPIGDGRCDVCFVLLRGDDVDDAAEARDAAQIIADLQVLKRRLESRD